MVAKEFYLDKEAGNDHSNEESTTLLLNPYDGDDDEEETLSLCDLPIYSSISSQSTTDFGGNSQSDNKDDDFDDFFEFFSEEFTTPSEDLIFCGKLIPFKDHHHHHQHVPEGALKKSNTAKRSYSKKGATPSLFLPNSVSSKSTSKAVMMSDGDSMGKVKLVRSSTTKARWFLFMFGMSKYSTTKMQLGDMRNRQSRRAPASMFPAPEDGNEVKIKGRSSFKGMWKMLTSISLVLGCHSSRQLANDVVKAAFV